MGERSRINLPELDPSDKHKLNMENQYENKCCGKQVPALIRRYLKPVQQQIRVCDFGSTREYKMYVLKNNNNPTFSFVL